jgi:hypothetical protein
MKKRKIRMNSSCHIVHYKGKVIIYDNGTYKVPELFNSFLSMSEAKKQIDKDVKETIVNLKTLNAKIKKTVL